MDSSNKTNLEKSIAQWRESLANTGSFNSEKLDELCDHLDDVYHNLDQTPLSHEERLLVAQHRIGSPATLRASYCGGVFDFTGLSWVFHGLVYFLIYRLLTDFVLGLASLISFKLGLETQTSYLLISLPLNLVVLGIVFLVYRWVEKMKQRSVSVFKINTRVTLALLLFSTNYVVKHYTIGTYMNLDEFPYLAYLFPFLVPVLVCVGFLLIINFSKWRNTMKKPTLV